MGQNYNDKCVAGAGESGWGRSEVEDEAEKITRGREHLHFTGEETGAQGGNLCP